MPSGCWHFGVAAILFLTVIPPVIAGLCLVVRCSGYGSEVGERFAKAVNQVWSPVMTIGFGTFLLMLVGGAIGLIPCLGGMTLFLLGLLGIGGSVITWFGVRPALVPAVTVYTPPTANRVR